MIARRLMMLPVVRQWPALFWQPTRLPAGVASWWPLALSLVWIGLWTTTGFFERPEVQEFYPWAMIAPLWLLLGGVAALSLKPEGSRADMTALLELLCLQWLVACALRPLVGDTPESWKVWFWVAMVWAGIGHASQWLGRRPARSCPIRALRSWLVWVVLGLAPAITLQEWLGPAWLKMDDIADTAAMPDDLPSAETLFARQRRLLKTQIDALADERPGVEDHYLVSVGGDASQDVFREEAQFARDVFDHRFDTRQRSIALINSFETWRDTPLASVHNLRTTLKAIGRKMNPDEDVLYLYLTSHGSPSAELAVTFGDVSFDALDADALRRALDSAHIKWRVIIVSACFSGSFIDRLQTPETLVLTAAAADRTSFGCSNERQFTYFGEALLAAHLNTGMPLMQAFEHSQSLIARREALENLTPSQPQSWIGEAMEARLASPQGARLQGGFSAQRLPTLDCASCRYLEPQVQPSSTTNATANARSSERLK